MAETAWRGRLPRTKDSTLPRGHYKQKELRGEWALELGTSCGFEQTPQLPVYAHHHSERKKSPRAVKTGRETLPWSLWSLIEFI